MEEVKKGFNEKIAFSIILGIVLIGLIIISFMIIYPKFKNAKPSLEIIKISGCSNCFNINLVKNSLDNSSFTLKSEKEVDYKSDEGKELIEKYGIERIPALILLSKNIDKIKLESNIFVIGKDYAIFDKSAPYINIGTGEFKGKIKIKEIYSDCTNCTSLSSIRSQLEKMGIVDDYELVPDSSEQGKQLIRDNGITFLPSLLVSKDIEEYWWIFGQIKSAFSEEKDYYLFKSPLPPYKSLATGEIKGKVSIIYLENKSCEDCFNSTILKEAFQSLGIYISNEKHVDIATSEGQALLIQYNITAIPTAILSKEIEDYPSLKSVLEQVGTFKNKEFVLRNLDSLNVKYQKLGG